MARYTKESKERVRDAVDMADLVSTRTELRRAGADRMSGLCPFHDERTPSFGINPSEKVYYCFGCQASGDAFTFVQETEGVDFKGALELLADRYGVTLELEDEDPRAAERRERRQRLLDLLERTAAFYVRYLWESDEAARARDYLAERGLEEGTLRSFRVGYAPSAWDRVLVRSRRAGYSEAELHEAGVAQRSQKGSVYDRFRAQIMFPLADARGRVLGFAGRRMAADDHRPKYVNSPESDLFHKRSQLFGADLARSAAARAGSVIVAEGYTDVIALHQGGLSNSVGIMGTALTEEQIAGLTRLAPVVSLALDADSAGQEAMLRAARMASKLELRVVPLPEGEDPAEVVQRSGAEEMERRIAAAVPFVRFRVERTLETGADEPDKVIDRLRPVFELVGPRTAQRAELEQMVANGLNVSPELVARELAAKPGATSGPAPANSWLTRTDGPEHQFLSLCIARPALGEAALTELDLDSDLSSPVTRRAAAHLRGHLAAPTADLDEDDAELVTLLRKLAVRAGELTEATEADFGMERLQLSLARQDRRIAAARRAGDGGVAELAAERSALQEQLDRLMDAAMSGRSPA